MQGGKNLVRSSQGIPIVTQYMFSIEKYNHRDVGFCSCSINLFFFFKFLYMTERIQHLQTMLWMHIVTGVTEFLSAPLRGQLTTTAEQM